MHTIVILFCSILQEVLFTCCVIELSEYSCRHRNRDCECYDIRKRLGDLNAPYSDKRGKNQYKRDKHQTLSCESEY